MTDADNESTTFWERSGRHPSLRYLRSESGNIDSNHSFGLSYTPWHSLVLFYYICLTGQTTDLGLQVSSVLVERPLL